MSGLERGERRSKWPELSWERLALQSRKRRLWMLVGIALCVQALFWGGWGRHVVDLETVSQAWGLGPETQDTFELASATMPDSKTLAEWLVEVGELSTADAGVWLDMALEAKRLGLMVIEPKPVATGPEPKASDVGITWRVQGAWVSTMQWVHHVTVEHPQLLLAHFEMRPIDDAEGVELHVLWQLTDQAFVLSNTPAVSWGEAIDALQRWELNHKPLLSPEAWPSFDGLDWTLGYQSSSMPWPDTWALEWQLERRHVLVQTPLHELRWKGAMMTQGRAVALVQVGAEMWTVEQGDSLGQGQHRVIKITADHMVLQQRVPGTHGQHAFRETVLGAYIDGLAP
jgi:hypothetical protein